MFHRQLADMMALAGAAKDQQPGRQRETGPAKKKSHNGSHSKRLDVEGARRKAENGESSQAVSSDIFSYEKCGAPSSFLRNEIERALRRITVSRSGSHYQEYRVE
jgi:hypothetical protein